jgi:putative nucleotidyltransferase with HDIG domain
MRQSILSKKNIITKLDVDLAPMNKMVEIMMNILYEKSEREMYHSARVSKICEAIATELCFDNQRINKVKMTGLIHDIGKIGVNRNILNKRKKFLGNEWKEIMKHPEIGYKMLKSVEGYFEIAKVVLEHHERWDGTGYPNCLKGNKISVEARLVAIADAYDSMTSSRSYRKMISKNKAINEIKKYSGTQFDPDIAGVFVEKVLTKNIEL